MLNSSLGFVLLFVADPIKSCEFYQKLFGIDPIELHPTFALFNLNNGVKLGLWSHKTAEPPVTVGGGGSEICFASDTVESVYEQCIKQGISIAQQPTDMDFGRTFVALDLDGHRIRVYKLWEK